MYFGKVAGNLLFIYIYTSHLTPIFIYKSAKRLGELQHHFNSSSDFGIGLSWRGYTVHDAANCLRRFLNYLPEPVIPFSLYEPFREIAANQSKRKKNMYTLPCTKKKFKY